MFLQLTFQLNFKQIMVCHCKRPSDGKLGCGDECLNRMLNIECVQGTCPCGDLCSNQQVLLLLLVDNIENIMQYVPICSVCF